MVLHLSTIGAAQADEPLHLATVHKSDAVENTRLRCERNHALFTVFDAVVHPHQRSIPIDLNRQAQGDAALLPVRSVFGGVELELHYLL
jgi:hypothetical protein